MTPAGVGNLSPGDSKTTVSDSLKGNEPTKRISQHCPRRRGTHPAKPQQAQYSYLKTYKWHLFAKARSVNDGKLNQRHLRPYFTDHIFIAMSRCRKPTSARLFETSCRPKLWDSVLQNEACHGYWKPIWKKLTAPHVFGKGFREANYKPSPNPIE
jgi:hypothetical protein